MSIRSEWLALPRWARVSLAAIGLIAGTGVTLLAAETGICMLPSLRIQRAASLHHTRVVTDDAQRALDAFVAGEGRCPSSAQEIVERGYRKRLRRDAWGQPLLYTCVMPASDVFRTTVRSAGPDRILWTDDDVR
jgi:hypothetical protein